jgi:XTP/dITP diphosphohydrolase/ATP diphosphatase
LALRRTNAKFRRRFAAMEQASGRALSDQDAVGLEALWAEVKQQEVSAAK